jgi:Putative zinc-finger
MTIDHETCSELLGPYVKGELHAGTRAEIEEHLNSCDECRAEEAGLRAIAAVEVEPLTDIERARLARSVRDEVGVPERSPKERMAWLPTALGAAAVLVALFFGFQFVSGLSGGNDEASEAGGASEDAFDAEELEGPQPRTLSLAAGRLQLDQASGAASESDSSQPESAPAPQAAGDDPPPEEPVGETSSNGLGSAPSKKLDDPGDGYAYTISRAARAPSLFRKFARAYGADDVDALRPAFLEVLMADAPDDTAADQLLECDVLASGARDVPMLPVLAAHGRHEGRPSLLLAYLSPDGESDELTETTFFIWPRGDCTFPSSTQFGKIEG